MDATRDPPDLHGGFRRGYRCGQGLTSGKIWLTIPSALVTARAVARVVRCTAWIDAMTNPSGTADGSALTAKGCLQGHESPSLAVAQASPRSSNARRGTQAQGCDALRQSPLFAMPRQRRCAGAARPRDDRAGQEKADWDRRRNAWSGPAPLNTVRFRRSRPHGRKDLRQLSRRRRQADSRRNDQLSILSNMPGS